VILSSRRVVLLDGIRPASVHVHNGRIASVDEYGAFSDALDLGDVALLPGLVDTHVHVNEPGRTEWEGFATATRAAAAGGVTTIVDMPLNSLPPTVTVAALEVKRAAAERQSFVDVGFWGGAIPSNLGSLRDLYEAGVFGFKSFLIDSGVPEFPPLDPAQLAAAGAEVPEALFIVHAEDPSLVTAGPSSPSYVDFVASRPPQAEVRAVSAALAAGGRVHILHLSSADALPLLAEDRCRM
jgi:allantoinase